MKRLACVACLFALVAMACGKEASIVPIVSVPPSSTTTPEPTAQVTYEPYATPTPTEQPLVTPPPTPTPTPVPSAAGPSATPAPTSGPHSFQGHKPTPTDAPPDAYLRTSTEEIKGLVTEYNWQTSPNKRSTYTDQTPDPSDSITVKQHAPLKILFTRTDQESDAGARYRKDPGLQASSTAVAITKSNPAEMNADFPTGTIWLDVFTYWPQGDVEHTFKLNVVS